MTAINDMTTTTDAQAEVMAYSLLRLAADRPGAFGRIRAARIVTARNAATRAADDHDALVARYGLAGSGWTIREVVQLIDAMIAGGLMAQTEGASPVLVLTRSGFLALEALQGDPLEA